MPTRKYLFISIAWLLCGGLSHADAITVYSCANGQLVQSQVELKASDSPTQLLRWGHAIWSSGAIDADTLEAIAEGRGIWAAAPLTTLVQVAGTTLPAEILTAIAVKETGRKSRFWPWSIHWGGRGYYLESRQQAIEAARYLIKAGYTNFDTAVMQVNWKWHGHRFASIEAAFDPITSIRVAEQILTENFKATGSWREAIARYHSKTPSLNQPYLEGVLKHMARIQKPNLESPEQKLC